MPPSNCSQTCQEVVTKDNLRNNGGQHRTERGGGQAEILASGALRLCFAAATGRNACPPQSKLVERALAFDAVELFGFPVDALFDHFEAVGRCLEQVPLRAGLQIAGRG